MTRQGHLRGFGLCTIALALAACQTHNFADPSLLSGGATYRGELTEAHLLDPGNLEACPTEAQAGAELQAGGRVLLVQSGAPVPDPELVSAFGDSLAITTYSGVPPEPNAPYTPIREAAVRAGADWIVCVQGRIQSEDRATDGTWVSWVPIFGWNLDDSELTTSLQIRFVTVNVRSGRWTEFSSAPLTDTVSHSPIDRNLGEMPKGVAATQAQSMKRTAFARAVPAFLQHSGLR